MNMYPIFKPSLPAASPVRPPTLLQKGGRVMTIIRKDIQAFMVASENLMTYEIMPAELNETEGHAIQFYLSALSEKFPALLT